MTLARRFIQYNQRLCRDLDAVLPQPFRTDGNTDFQRVFAPRFVRPNTTIYDVGGGKQPFFSPSRKKELGLTVIGVDISKDELNAAPPGAYDQVIAHDIATFRGAADGDLVICQAVLEHVQDVEAAFQAIASCLKPGGIACLFVPSRNAVFARLNLLLPQSVKTRLLFSLFPDARRAQGFPSYYRHCTPAEFEALARANDLEVAEAKHYYLSKYFTFFAPAHAVWRAWNLSFAFFKRSQAAETFSMALKKA